MALAVSNDEKISAPAERQLVDPPDGGYGW